MSSLGYCASKAQISGEDVNVRADSTVMAESLGLLDDGEVVEIIGDNFDWYKIRLPKKFDCYISDEFIKDKGDGKGEITAATLNLRSQPALNSQVIGKIKRGKIVTIIEKANGWCRIVGYPHAAGWINKNFLQIIANDVDEESVVVAKKGTILPFYRNGCPATYVLLENKKRTLLRIEYDNGRKFVNKKAKINGKKINGDSCEYVYVEKLSLEQ